MDSIQQAIQDVAEIRRAIERSSAQPAKARRAALTADLLVQAISLACVLFMLLFELLTDHEATEVMLLSAQIPKLGTIGLAMIGLALPLLIMCLYFIVWRSSRHGEQDFSAFVGANFHYLHRLSLVADLVVKFVVLSLLVLGSQPEWIGPVLALFTADYLFQGRFFHFSVRNSLLLGLACLGATAALLLTGTALLAYPLGIFGALNGLSLAGLWLAVRRCEVA